MPKISPVPIPSRRHGEEAPDEPPKSWSTRRANNGEDEKRLIASYCAAHDFLVRPGCSPETDDRDTVASVLVNQGTTPNVVVEEALAWISANSTGTSFDITWFTTGSLVPSTLRQFRLRNPKNAAAAQVFLFPGRVDHEIEAVSGPEPVDFAAKLNRCFSYAFLSAYTFDIERGSFYFHYSSEIELQKQLACLFAAQKFVFLDPSKFRAEGGYSYGIWDLLRTSEVVTIYTVSSSADPWIKARFKTLCDTLFYGCDGDIQDRDTLPVTKTLRLRVVGRDEPTDHIQVQGKLRER